MAKKDEPETRQEEQKKTKETNEEEEYDNGEMKFGLRLLDDLMNTFCDRLQKAAQHTIEGMLAIQFVLVDPSQLPPLITGKNPVVQILLDEEREHYVVVHYEPERHMVIVYDSIYEFKKWKKATTVTIRKQIFDLFGHLYENGDVDVAYDARYETQDDEWSCGYRSVACCLELARKRRPSNTSYDLQKIYDFLSLVNSSPDAPWSIFEEADIGKVSSRREVLDNCFWVDSDDWYLASNWESKKRSQSVDVRTTSPEPSPKISSRLTGVFSKITTRVSSKEKPESHDVHESRRYHDKEKKGSDTKQRSSRTSARSSDRTEKSDE